MLAPLGALDRLPEPVEADRLQQIIGGLDLEGVGRILLEGGDEDDLRPVLAAAGSRRPEGRSARASGCRAWRGRASAARSPRRLPGRRGRCRPPRPRDMSRKKTCSRSSASGSSSTRRVRSVMRRAPSAGAREREPDERGEAVVMGERLEPAARRRRSRRGGGAYCRGRLRCRRLADASAAAAGRCR